MVQMILSKQSSSFFFKKNKRLYFSSMTSPFKGRKASAGKTGIKVNYLVSNQSSAITSSTVLIKFRMLALSALIPTIVDELRSPQRLFMRKRKNGNGVVNDHANPCLNAIAIRTLWHFARWVLDRQNGNGVVLALENHYSNAFGIRIFRHCERWVLDRHNGNGVVNFLPNRTSRLPL